mgnify:CR=1 FL=1
MKYMGSKSRIKKHLVPILQQLIDQHQIHTYVEPFVGGCNVIDDIQCSKRIGSDHHPYLMALWEHLIQGGELPSAVSKDYYASVRREKETQFPAWEVGAVGFLASYNGRFFDGGYAKDTLTKTGVVRHYYDEARRNILTQVPKVKDVEFHCLDYRAWSHLKGTLIYCDIPYQNTKQFSNSKDFDYEEFWAWAKQMSKYNIVLVSEQTIPEDISIIWEQPVTRTQNNRSRQRVTEKLALLMPESFKSVFV